MGTFYRPQKTNIIEILANGADDNAEIHQLNSEVTLSIPVTQEMLDAYEGAQPSDFSVYYYDEEAQDWIPQSASYNSQTQTLVAKIKHFSLFNTQVSDFDSVVIPSLDAAQTSEFTGSASYAYPINVPSGIGGVAPSISINYNSLSAENLGMKSQAGIVGLGWSLSAGGSVIRNRGKNTPNDDTDDTFSFNVGGVSSDLIPVSTGTDSNGDYTEYKASDDNFWKIRRYISYGYELETYTWRMWDKTGTKYTFNQNALYLEYVHCSDCDQTDTYTQKPWGTFLTDTSYANGDTIHYDYIAGWHSQVLGARWSYYSHYYNVSKISYGHSPDHPSGYYTVEFGYTSRDDRLAGWKVVDSGSVLRYEDNKLSTITVKANGTVVRSYELDYYPNSGSDAAILYPGSTFKPDDSYPGEAKVLVLHKITEVSAIDATTNASVSKPPVTFTYGEQTIDGETINGNDFIHLTKVDNGQGGSVTFVYEDLDDSTPAGEPYHAENPDDDTSAIHNGDTRIFANGAINLGYAVKKPGSAYIVNCKYDKEAATATFRLNISQQAGISSNIEITATDVFYPAFAFLRSDAVGKEDVLFQIFNTSASQNIYVLDGCTIAPVVTHYRVLRRIVKDSLSSISYQTTYDYTGPHSNSPDVYSSGFPLYDKDDLTKSQTHTDTTFWGHEAVTKTTKNYGGSTAMQGAKVESHFIVNENNLGKMTVQKTLSGGTFTFSKTVYETQPETPNYTDASIKLLCAKKSESATSCFLDKKVYWNYTNYTENRVYNDNGDPERWGNMDAPEDTLFQGSRSDYIYSTALQYGNLTGEVVRLYEKVDAAQAVDSSLWPDYRATRTGYKATVQDGVKYLTGLPVYTNTYKCPNGTCDYQIANLMASSCTIYGNWDGSGSSIPYVCGMNKDGDYLLSTSPQTSLVQATRQLVNFDLLADKTKDYDHPRYFDTINTYATKTATGLNLVVPTGQKTYSVAGTKDELATGGENKQIIGYFDELGGTEDYGFTRQKWVQNGPDATWRTQYSYANANGNLFDLPSQETDINGATATATYDTFGRIKTLRLPDANGASHVAIEADYFDYANGTPANVKIDSLFDATNSLKTYTRSYYNGLGQKFVSVQAGVDVYTGITNGTPSVLADRDLLSHTLFDKLGRVTGTSATYSQTHTEDGHNAPPAGTLYTTNTYNASNGFMTQAKDLSGRTTTFSSVLEEDTSTTYPHQVFLIKKTTDNAGLLHWQYFDTKGRLIKSVQKALSDNSRSEIRYAYDTDDRITSIQPVGGAATTFEYNFMGQKTKMVDPDMGTWDYAYDTLGNLISQTDAKRQTTCMFYDAMRRLVGVLDKTSGVCDTSTADPGFDITFTNPAGKNSYQLVYDQVGTVYDKDGNVLLSFANTKGRLSSARMPAGTMYYSYDEQGHIKAQVFVSSPKLINPSLGTYKVEYTYYFDGKPHTVTYPNGRVLTYTRDSSGRDTDIKRNTDTTVPLIGSGSTAYDEMGRLRYLSIGTSLYSSTDYYPLIAGTETGGLLKSISVAKKANNSNLYLKQYLQYDESGNITDVSDLINGETETINYNYDGFSRLLSAHAYPPSTSSLPSLHENFGYDALGRLNSKSSKDYSFDAAHPHAVSKVTDDNTNVYGTYQYDANGNMTTRTENGITYTQTWTADNHLKNVTWGENGAQAGGQHEVTYTYDSAGTRILRVENFTDMFNQHAETTTVYIGGIYEKQINTSAEDVTTYLNSWVR